MPPQASHSSLLKVLLVLVAVVVFVAAGFSLYYYFTHSVPNSPADIVYAARGPSGTSSWYEVTKGWVTDHPSVPSASIVGIARAAGKTFLLGASGSSYTLYIYDPAGKNYASKPLAVQGQTLSGLSVDVTGRYAATTGTGGGATPQVEILTISTGAFTTLASGHDPIFLGNIQSIDPVGNTGKTMTSDTGYLSVVYADADKIRAKTLHWGTWSSPAVAYNASGAFPANNSLAGDGTSLFALIDPATFLGQVLGMKTPNPFTPYPKALYRNAQTPVFGLVKGGLVGLTVTPGGSNGQTTSVQVRTFAPHSMGSTSTASSTSISIPLRAAGTGQPSFIGLIPSI